MYNPMQQYSPNPSYVYQDNLNVYQQRLNNMAQQVTGQGQPQGNAFMGFVGSNLSNQINNFNIRAVTGYEEAVASQIPLDGSVSIFTDFSHNRIFTKQLNMSDGTALMKTYSLSENPKSSSESMESSVEYVKKSEFDELQNKFNELWNAITEKPSQSKTTSTIKKESAK